MAHALLSAFACDPFFGSDEEVGWQWARELSSRSLHVTVLTRRSHRAAIEKCIRETGQCAQVRFEYLDIDWLHRILRRINRRNHIYYYFWQWVAYRHAQALNSEHPFDLVHHVTWVSFRQPSFMGRVGAPFIFGPVAGAEEAPAGYMKGTTVSRRLLEWVRFLANRIVRYDPLMMMTFRQADRLFFTSAAHLRRIPEFAKNKARIELAIAAPPIPECVSREPEQVLRKPSRLLFVGRCIAQKGLDVGLEVFANVLSRRPDVSLTIVGDGEERKRWERKADDLGVSSAIQWLGWKPKSEVQNLYRDFDLFFFPSLRDSGGFVVLEALQAGLPVVCFALGGPSVIVDQTCGVAVDAGPDVRETVQRYAQAVLDTLARTHSDASLADACRRRAANFQWSALIARIYGPLLNEAVREA